MTKGKVFGVAASEELVVTKGRHCCANATPLKNKRGKGSYENHRDNAL
jgi:hypothetical protein